MSTIDQLWGTVLTLDDNTHSLTDDNRKSNLTDTNGSGCQHSDLFAKFLNAIYMETLDKL